MIVSPRKPGERPSNSSLKWVCGGLVYFILVRTLSMRYILLTDTLFVWLLFVCLRQGLAFIA
jgi:hypothetical protein